ncbi:hypothetical protein [Streptomyces albipurpureus]|uniref:Uncharacterized protein n=1 Tax=Streptomyces albipurpureus TaxID=2897419 RepID=A0ABT0UWJ2_9ACTN|nr:hypothetical protein [Streptomyces sp. CWNU-1]MCM2392005.1 hypothetical protein [Streptomyces sp. CWNU-1]
MSLPAHGLYLADAREAEDLTAFLARLIHYDRAAAVRLQAGGSDGPQPHLAVFGRPPSFEVLAIRTARLAAPAQLDITVSAGELLEGIAGAGFTVPDAVTGPPWAGVLPPRGGWHKIPGLPTVEAMREAVAAAVAEFRYRDEALPDEQRIRTERDRIGREIWSRTVGAAPLPLRAVHAAQSLGFLPPGVAVALLGAGSWLRLRTPFGSIAVRMRGLGGLDVTPARG